MVINEHELKTDTMSKVHGEMSLLIRGKQIVLDVAGIPRTLLALLNPC